MLMFETKFKSKGVFFWWQKRNILTIQGNFTERFSDPSQNLSILQCFTTFFPDTLVDQIAENTNLYTVWRINKSADTNEIKIKVFIGMHMLMSIDNKIATIFWLLEQHTPKSSYLVCHVINIQSWGATNILLKIIVNMIKNIIAAVII